MNRLSSRNDRLAFKTSGNSPIVWEDTIEYTSNEWKQKRKMPTCNRLDFRITGILTDSICPKTSRTLVSGPLRTWGWEPVTISLQALIGGKGRPGPSHFKLCLRDQRSMWMQDRCKVYMDSYMASNGSCFMITWTIFKNHLLEAGLTQNQETMKLRTFVTIELFSLIMCEDPHE